MKIFALCKLMYIKSENVITLFFFFRKKEIINTMNIVTTKMKLRKKNVKRHAINYIKVFRVNIKNQGCGPMGRDGK